MDRLLKDRKLASASARKKRIQERDEMLTERQQERHSRRERFRNPSLSDDNSSRASSPDIDSALETPSEYSARTPDNLSSPEVELTDQLRDTSDSTSGTVEEDEDEDTVQKMDTPSSRTTRNNRQTSRTDPKATNFPYYRFSTYIPDIDTSSDEDDEPTPVIQQDSASEYEDDEEPYTPIEVATSVAYSMPKKKPSLIRVSTQQSLLHHHRSMKSINMLHNGDRPPPLRPMKSVDGFIASEARPVEFPQASPPLPRSRHISNSPSVSTTASIRDESETTIRRKSSMPMLGKFAHARMNSLKNFIKPIPAPSAPEVPQIPSRHQHHPSTANKYLPQTPIPNPIIYSSHASLQPCSAEPRRSLTEPALVPRLTPATEKRPQTARMPSSHEVTALPRSSSPQEDTKSISDQVDGYEITRKKSFAGLRRRSGSIGSALKMAPTKSKPVPQESPPPPVPTFVSLPKEPVSVAKMPHPLAKSPRMSRSGGYSPFPRPSKPGEPIGLGLRV